MPARHNSPVWLWMNLLSLDAPLVALVWQDFLARIQSSPLRPAGRWTLGLTVWAIYLADRLLDVRHTATEVETTRHAFYRRNRLFAMVLLAMVLLVDVVIALQWLRPAVFDNGLLVALAVSGYLVVFPAWRIRARRWKQPMAAVLFTTGVFIVAWTWTAQPWQVLLWPALALALLFAGNMVMVETWKPGMSTGAGWWSMLLLMVVCLLMGGSPWYFAVAASAAGLAILDRFGGRLSQDGRGVLADLVLLTPLLFR